MKRESDAEALRADVARLEAELTKTRAEKDLFEGVLRALPVSCLVVVGADQYCRLLAGRELASFPFPDVPGKRPADVVPPHLGAYIEGAHAEVLRGAEMRDTVVVEDRSYRVHRLPAKTQAGDVVGALILAEDVTEGVVTENALRTTEERCRVLFENATEAIALIASEGERAGDILAANPALAALSGYSVDELCTMKVVDLTRGSHEESAGAVRAEIEAQGWADGAAEITRKDGTRVVMEHRTGVVRFDGQRVAVSFGRDTTKRRRIETRLRDLFEQAPDGIFVWNADTRYVEVNTAACLLAGYSRHELLSMSVEALVPPEERARFAALEQRIGLHGDTYAGEGIILRKDGRRTAVEMSVRLLSDGNRQAIVRDVSARKRLEEEREDALRRLRASEERYRVIVEDSAEAIFALWVEGERAGGILTANAAAAALVGRSVDDLRRQTLFTLVPPEDVEATRARLARIAREGRLEDTVTFVRNDGTRAPIELRASLVQLRGERVALALGHDVSERLTMEAALREAKEDAESANRVKSAFLANMSHEIRTPIHAILGYTQLLLHGPALDDEQRKYLEIIGKSGDQLLALMNDLLETSKIEAGDVRVHHGTVDLSTMLEVLERMFRLRADAKRLAFEVNCAPDVPRFIVSDESKLRHILVSLLSNATKFTHRGGVVARVRAAKQASGRDELVVEIADTGPGLAPGELASLFRPFSQARVGIEARGGAGLGLALSRQFARLLGGDITVESTVGQGSVFRLVVPLTVARAPSRSEARALEGARVAGLADEGAPPRILLVDDADDQRTAAATFLRRLGFDVREADDAAEAAVVCEAWSPNLVVMDVAGPRAEGVAAMRALRALGGGRKLALVALAGPSDEGTRAAMAAAGADGWLEKPYRLEELLGAIAEHCGVRYRHRETVAPRGPTVPARPLAPLPPELAAPLREAARIADYARLRELIDALPATYGDVAEELRAMAEEYAYDRIESRLAG